MGFSERSPRLNTISGVTNNPSRRTFLIASTSWLALAASGEAGLKRMLELMDVEIRTAMGLMGVTSLDQLSASWVRPAAPVRHGT